MLLPSSLAIRRSLLDILRAVAVNPQSAITGPRGPQGFLPGRRDTFGLHAVLPVSVLTPDHTLVGPEFGQAGLTSSCSSMVTPTNNRPRLAVRRGRL